MTRTDFNVLESLEWGERHFGGLLTGRQTRRRDMLRLVARGWARSQGAVYVCDDDGFLLQPERMREGFEMTPKGRAALTRARTRLAANGYPKECA